MSYKKVKTCFFETEDLVKILTDKKKAHLFRIRENCKYFNLYNNLLEQSFLTGISFTGGVISPFGEVGSLVPITELYFQDDKETVYKTDNFLLNKDWEKTPIEKTRYFLKIEKVDLKEFKELNKQDLELLNMTESKIKVFYKKSNLCWFVKFSLEVKKND